MKWNNLEQFFSQNKDKMEEPFFRNDILWEKIHSELNTPKKRATNSWWIPLTGVATAVFLGIIAVIGLNEYRQLTLLGPEVASSVTYYENLQGRLIRNINAENRLISPDLQKDLIEINQYQELLKKALNKVPSDKKDWIYSSLIDTYELKISLLEKMIYNDRLEQQKMQKNASNL